MKYTMIIFLMIGIAGCESKTTELGDYPLPPEMKHCRVYSSENKTGGWMKIVYCPNATTSTTYNIGRSSTTTVVIDGKIYEEKK